jgi:hypothetical protein
MPSLSISHFSFGVMDRYCGCRGSLRTSALEYVPVASAEKTPRNRKPRGESLTTLGVSRMRLSAYPRRGETQPSEGPPLGEEKTLRHVSPFHIRALEHTVGQDELCVASSSTGIENHQDHILRFRAKL